MTQTNIKDHFDGLLAQMTLSEKIAILSGKNNWYTMAIERLGIPSIVMTDGPHGVRTGGHGTGRMVSTATAYPTGISMASTWNRNLIFRVGAALAEEARHLGCHILLGPCVNIIRSPLAGRNFETYSEDPFLAGQIGVAYVKGLQSQQIGASVKHFAANNQEFERFRGNSIVDERTLREIYLPAFEIIIKEAKPWTVMCAYNRINGIYASEHEVLLRWILKDEWGFDGVVVSDWGAVHNIHEPITGGLDLEMPGPARYFGQALEAAVNNWQVEMRYIDEAVRRMLGLLNKTGVMSEQPKLKGSGNTPEHRALARELAVESMVLLKNDDKCLPLNQEKMKKLAVIGLNADRKISGGGSSRVDPHYWVTPLEGIREKLGDTVAVEYEPGYDNRVNAISIEKDCFTQPDSELQGLKAEYFNNLDFSGEPVLSRVDSDVEAWWGNGGPATGIVDHKQYSVRWSGTFIAPESGMTNFYLHNTGMAKVWLGDELILSNDIGLVTNSSFDRQKMTAKNTIILEKGKQYDFIAEFISGYNNPYALIQLSYRPPLNISGDLATRAVDLAKNSDAVVIVAGLPDKFESEGYDRPDMNLPGGQDELIRAVAAANARTVVVVNAGAPVSMPWVDDVNAILLMYYPGQEGGHALAEILFGEINPSGKLTTTFPRRLEDNPAYLHIPGWRDVQYGEGLFVGYRYYDTKDVEPLFPFGHGLSYTNFKYRELVSPEVVQVGEDFEVSITLKNVGQVVGQEIIQLYIRDVRSSQIRPQKELKAFEKIALEPGEKKTVSLLLNARSLSFYDPYQMDWVAEPGRFEVLIGASSKDIRLQGTFDLVEVVS